MIVGIYIVVYETDDEAIEINDFNLVGKYIVANTSYGLSEKVVFDTDTGEVIRKPGD
jgi:hypothetical protein